MGRALIVVAALRSLPVERGEGEDLVVNSENQKRILALLLEYLIWGPRPSSSTWAIGILVGINLIVSGFTRLMCSFAARAALKATA